MTTYFSGRVHSVIFENESFYVLRVVLDAKVEEGLSDFVGYSEPITVRGTVPGMKIETGSWFGFEGKWTEHEHFGRQVHMTRAPVLRDGWTPEAAKSALSSHGVGPMVVSQIESHFGDEFATKLGDQKALEEVPGLTPFTAEHVAGRWHAIQSLFNALGFLHDLKLPKARIDKIWARFGDETEKILSTNPWALVQIAGITFQQADEIARRLGLPLSSPTRVSGAVLHASKSRRDMGHLYNRSAEIFGEIQSVVPDITPRSVAEALAMCRDEGTLIIDADTRPGLKAIYEPWFYRVESASAESLVDRLTFAALTAKDEIEKYTAQLALVGPETAKSALADPYNLQTVALTAIHEWGSGSQMALSDLQAQGVLHALTEPVSVITGLPGTGKTTSLRALVRIFQDAEVSFLLMAPTGIAAKRLQSVTGAQASTIHRAFSAKGIKDSKDRKATYVGVVGSSGSGSSDGSAEDWGFSPEDPYPADVIIVDEASMVDQHLLYRVLTCTRPNARLVFVGDAAQLPSVGPGNVLHDIINSGVFATVDLTEIYRQENTSDIVVAAHEIHAGKVPSVLQGSPDFKFAEVKNEGVILDNMLEIVGRLYDQRSNFQVLSPKHGDTLGVTNLNDNIRARLNPAQPSLQEMKVGNSVLREDDRIMVVKNNYELGIFNGDTGKIVRIRRKDREVEIKIHGPPVMHVRIPFKDVARYLRLAYAVTIHKMQGLEADVIVMPWVSSFHQQLQRNLLYTAVTRARKRVIILGHRAAFQRAVLNARVSSRNTLLPLRIASLLAGDRKTAAQG